LLRALTPLREVDAGVTGERLVAVLVVLARVRREAGAREPAALEVVVPTFERLRVDAPAPRAPLALAGV